MTAKEIVMQKYPDAFAFEYDGRWQIGSPSYSFPLVPLEEEVPRFLSQQDLPTEATAWADAASRLQSEREDEGGK